MKNLETTRKGKKVIGMMQEWYNMTEEQATRCMLHLAKENNVETEKQLGALMIHENDVLVWVDKNREETYTWNEINKALMNKGYSPARIADILIELTHITKK